MTRFKDTLRSIFVVSVTAVAVLAGLANRPAVAGGLDPQDAFLCQNIARAIEAQRGIPPQLLAALTLTETGKARNLTDGTRVVTGWPWTINVEGRGYWFDSREAAISRVKQLLAKGIRSIDVGCMQVNLRYHGEAFETLEEAFDPVANVSYASEFLTQLFEKHGSWMNAVERYHSGTRKYYLRYRAKVFDNWVGERERVAEVARTIRVAQVEEFRARRFVEVARRRAAIREELANAS